MSKHGIESPERSQEYRAGEEARRLGLSKETCPFGIAKGVKRGLFLAGWHDMDIALGGRS